MAHSTDHTAHLTATQAAYHKTSMDALPPDMTPEQRERHSRTLAANLSRYHFGEHSIHQADPKPAARDR